MRILSVLFIVLLLSCSSKHSSERNYHSDIAPSAGMEESDKAASSDVISSSAAKINPKDSVRKFVRTADMRFRVKDVRKTSIQIEDLTFRNGGFVTYTNLKSNIYSNFTTQINKDSLLETTRYVVENDIVLRIPNQLLDTTLREIARSVDFLDYRVIKADDVSLQILSNQMIQNRARKHGQRIENAVNNQSQYLVESVIGEDIAEGQHERAENAKLGNIALMDQVNMSTINLHLYQRVVCRYDVLEQEKSIKAFEPGFFKRAWDSIVDGWNTLEEFIVIILKLWSVVLIIILIVFLTRYFINWLKKKNIKL